MNIRFFFALVALTASAAATDWPQYRGPLGDGSTPDRIAIPWPGTGPKQLWKVASSSGFSSFAVAGNRCFTLETREAEGAPQEALIARDAASGKELWVAPLGATKYSKGGDDGASDNQGGDGPRSTPTMAGNAVISLNAQLVLHAFHAANGKPLWKRDLQAEHAGRNIRWENAASPLLEGGLIYLVGGGADESLLAIDPKDGKVVAKGFDELTTHATPVAATIAGQRQIIFFVQSGLLAVEPKTLKELWRYPFPFKISTAASPVVGGDIVYCSAGYDIGAGAVKVTRTAGKWEAKELYRFRGNKPLANHWSTPVHLGGHLYGMFQFKEYGTGPVKCVELATGAVKWEQPGFGPGHVIRSANQVLALTDKGELVLFEAKPDAYKELARAKVLTGKCWTTPVLANGRVYVRSTREAACYDLGSAVAAR
jgi:outer membrane protein assembly factor BamB